MGNEITLDEDGADLCIHCLKPVGEHAAFCIHCRAPLGFLAGSVSYYSVIAEGFIYRTAVQQPKRLSVVIGVWVIFGFMAISGAFSVYAFHLWAEYYKEWIVTYFQLMYGLYSVIGVSAIYQSTMNYLDYRNQLRIDREQGETSSESE